jgi:hypothetical protein
VEAALKWPHLSDALGFTSLILLAYPALAAVNAARENSRFLDLDFGNNVAAELREHKARLEQQTTSALLRWNRGHSACLYIGYGCAVGSYVVKWL